jgi:hypothetical protein
VALRIAETTANGLTESLPVNFALFTAYANIAHVYLSVWEQDGKGVDLTKAAYSACQALSRFARLNPAAQPRAWLHRGRYEWLMGRQWQAQRSWQRALAQAEKLKMTYDVGLVHWEIGHHLTADTEKRKAHLS